MDAKIAMPMTQMANRMMIFDFPFILFIWYFYHY